MKKIFLIFCGLFFTLTYSQSKKLYIFNVEINDYNNVPKVENVKGVMKYIGNDAKENAFFSKYTIIQFYQTYPSSKVNKSLNMFTFVTQNSNLKDDLLINFPKKYLRIEDLTDDKIELLNSYPNDYGATSPVTNLGANLSLKSFDYINAPKAWDYFPNNKGNVTIGISDGKVNNSDVDFGSKVSYLNESSFYPTFSCSTDSWHGTSVGAIAAAQGNNAHGMDGVCYDCKILNVPYTLTYNGLLDLANAGVRVINMSWANMYQDDITYTNGYVQSQQDIINQLHEMGVVLVAAAGNLSSYSAAAPNYHRYGYPASYNHVISVTVVQAKNHNFTDEVTTEPFGLVSWYNEDLITPTGSFNGGVYSPYYEGTTTNSRVDICGPGYAPLYSSYLLGCSTLYASATSAATPYVTATAALMQSLNSCLSPDEVEDILQLSSKNIEANPYNFMYVGRLGSGKLETGDAVEFVSNMMNPSGNALIDGQDFWRFNFDLKHINNKLTISNQLFRDQNTSNFVSKKSIEIINSDFRPNSDGFVDLKIDGNLVVCDTPQSSAQARKSQNDSINSINYDATILYPNPNKGIFTIILNNNNDLKGVSVNVYDVLGKSVYNTVSNETKFDISIPNLPSGLYFVKLTSENLNETLKLIKE